MFFDMSKYNKERYVVNDDGEIIDIFTGETKSKKELFESKEKELIEGFYGSIEEMSDLGYLKDMRVVQYKGVSYPCKTVKEKYMFGKVFNVVLREIMSSGELSLNARAFIATFEPYISFPYNSIVIKSQYPTQKQYEDIMGLKKSALYSLFKQLEAMDIIKRVKMNNCTVIYFNPFLYASGGIVHEDIYDMFKSSLYNPDNNKLDTHG